MPALGKSGTWRIKRFKSSMRSLLPDIETGFIAGDAKIARLDRFDPSARRAVSDAPLESRERFGFPFGANLEATVRQVANPAVEPFPRRGVAGEESKPHTLNSAADDELTGVTHAGERAIISRRLRQVARPVIPPLTPASRSPASSMEINEFSADLRFCVACRGGTDLAYSNGVRTRPEGGAELSTNSQVSLSHTSRHHRAPVGSVPSTPASTPDPETPSA